MYSTDQAASHDIYGVDCNCALHTAVICRFKKVIVTFKERLPKRKLEPQILTHRYILKNKIRRHNTAQKIHIKLQDHSGLS